MLPFEHVSESTIEVQPTEQSPTGGADKVECPPPQQDYVMQVIAVLVFVIHLLVRQK